MGHARMQHLEQHGFADQVQAGRDAGDAHWQSWSANAVSSLMDADVEDESAIGDADCKPVTNEIEVPAP
jgi:hypothetical protein